MEGEDSEAKEEKHKDEAHTGCYDNATVYLPPNIVVSFSPLAKLNCVSSPEVVTLATSTSAGGDITAQTQNKVKS